MSRRILGAVTALVLTLGFAAKVEAASLEVGYASWYGGSFHGRRSASGEIYNQNRLTAAHPDLPLGTKVKVTNLENGKAVILRINDRGPYVDGRIVDVSRAAARLLGFARKGLALVRIESIEPENNSPADSLAD